MEKKYIKPTLKIVIDIDNQDIFSNGADDQYRINASWDDGSGGVVSKPDDGELDI